jgi:adenylate cyclase
VLNPAAVYTDAAPPPSASERKSATILFTDVKSSMELSASVELEDWWAIMRSLFDLMYEGVHRFGGWIGNFTGDGIVAVFEDEPDNPEHADRCCDAALWLREAIRSPAQEVLNMHGLELSVRMGMHSGAIITGAIDGPDNHYYTATGFAVSLAKRIEGLALPGRIYISEHTAKLLRPGLELRDLGAFAVKGTPLPVGVFELAGQR